MFASARNTLLDVTQQCFRAVNRLAGPDFGRTATGKKPKSVLRQAVGQPEGRCRCFPGSSPAKSRPGRPIYGPEALLRNIKYDMAGKRSKIASKFLVQLGGPFCGLGDPSACDPRGLRASLHVKTYLKPYLPRGLHAGCAGLHLKPHLKAYFACGLRTSCLRVCT